MTGFQKFSGRITAPILLGVAALTGCASPPPDFAANGATFSDGALKSQMIATAASGDPQTAVDEGSLTVAYDPEGESFTMTASMEAPDGSETNTQSFTATTVTKYDSIGYKMESDGGINQAYLDLGTWAYAGHVQVDDGGDYRQAAGFAGGNVNAALPTSGTAEFTGRALGSLEHTSRGGDVIGTEIVAMDGTVTAAADFGAAAVTVDYALSQRDSGESLGTLTSTLDLSATPVGTGAYAGTNSGTITLNGASYAIDEGYTIIGFAGPNEEEAAGTFSLNGQYEGETVDHLITGTGAFLLFK